MSFWQNLISDLFAEIILLFITIAATLLAMRYRGQARRLWRGRPHASPDGNSIATQHDGEILVTTMLGIHNITQHPADDINPIWSPDGKMIAYISHRDNDWEVYVWDKNTGHTARLTHNRGIERPVGWDAMGNLVIDWGGSLHVIKHEEIEKQLGK